MFIIVSTLHSKDDKYIYSSICTVAAVDATFGPQLGITEEKLASSPPAKSNKMSSGDSSSGIKVRSSASTMSPLKTLAFFRSATDRLICEYRVSLTCCLVHCNHKLLSPAMVTAISPCLIPTDLSETDPLVDKEVPSDEAASAIEYSIASGSPTALTCLGASAANTVTALESEDIPRSSCNPGQCVSECASPMQ